MNDATLHALVLGIVQGFTEFLPISSSAHLIVLSWIMDGKELPIELTIALHMGTLLAVILYFWREWVAMGKAAFGRVVRGEKTYESETLLPAIVVGSIPAGVLGLLFHKQIEAVFHHPFTVIGPMLIMGIVLWQVDKRMPMVAEKAHFSIKDAFLIGCGQACALIPGMSRSGSTILVARLLKIPRSEAARFSFLLSTPVLAGAGLLEGKKLLANVGDPVFVVGFTASFVFGILSVGGLIKYLRTFGFGAFAVYRVIFAVAVFVIVMNHSAQ